MTGPPDSGSDAVSLTGLLRDYGALWEITKTPGGCTARRRPPPAPPTVLTAATVPELRELLEHGYDTGKLAAIMRDYSGPWDIERLDPGSAWVAVSSTDGLTQVIAAADLDALRGKLRCAPGETPA
jgi:hypothetical protein